jgi:hypothetical protein
VRPVVTVVVSAAGAALATLVLAWPSPTYADPAEMLVGTGVIEKVTFAGKLERDASVRSGWIVSATFENGGDEDTTGDLDLEVTRASVSPDGRTVPDGSVVWKHREHVVVPAHGHVARSEEVPPWLGAQLVHNERATTQAIWVSSQLAVVPPEVAALFAAPGFKQPRRPFTLFQVAFQQR